MSRRSAEGRPRRRGFLSSFDHRHSLVGHPGPAEDFHPPHGRPTRRVPKHPPGPRRGFHVPHTRVTAGLGALFTPRPRGAQPTGPIPPAVARPLFQGPGPIAPVHIPSPEAVYYGASSRVHSRSPARPSPRPGHPWMEQGQPWAHSPGSAPRRPGACSARRGGRRASSTRPELPHDRHRRTSYPAAHS